MKNKGLFKINFFIHNLGETVSFISVKIFNQFKTSLPSLRVSVINKIALKNRIDAFVQERQNNSLYLCERRSGARRELFQDETSELFFLPTTTTHENEISSGDLYILFDETCKSFFLCFIPTVDAKPSDKTPTDFTGTGYPDEASIAPRYTISNRLCSFFVYERGNIVKCSDGSFLLKGLSISLLLKRTVFRALLLKKEEDFSAPEHPLGEVACTSIANKFVLITCLSTERGFFFHLKLPLLTDAALQQAVNEACIERAQALTQDASNVQDETKSSNLFPSVNDSCYTICLPSCMKINFESGQLEDGKIFCSCFNFEAGKNNVFTIVVLPSDFRKGVVTSSKPYNRKIFPLWQIDGKRPKKTYLSTQDLCLFRNKDCELVSRSETEYFIEGLDLRLVFTAKEAYLGLFCSRQKKEVPPSSASSFRPSRKRHLKSSKSSLKLPCTPLVSDPQPSIPQTSILNLQTGTPWSMNLPHTQSASPASHTQSSSLLPSMWNFPADPSQSPIGMSSTQFTGFYTPFPSQISESWLDPQTGPSQGPIGMSSAQSTSSYGLLPSQTSESWWDPQAGPSQGPIGMSSAQSTSSYGLLPSQTSESWWDPQAGPSQGPIGMSSAQSTSSYGLFPSQTSESWWDPQAGPSQGPIGMSSAQSTSSYGLFPSQTSESWLDPQTGPSQGPIGMSSAQPTSSYGVLPSQTSWMAANPQAAALCRTEGLTLQGALNISDGNKLEHFTLQDLPLDELQHISGEEKNFHYLQSEND